VCRPLSGGMKIVVLDAGTLAFDDAVWSALGELGDVQLYVSTSSDAETIIQRIREAEVVFTNKVPLSAEVLEAAASLKFIGVLATGYNVVDVAAAARLGQTLCNVPAYGATTTAQHAVALILELCNQVGQHSASVHAGDAEALADAMVRMIALEDGGRAMAKKCMANVQAQYSLDAVMPQIEALLSASMSAWIESCCRFCGVVVGLFKNISSNGVTLRGNLS
jgi:lactate dehydrogenase-like 2-hydroxyacid dehydrogenase